MSITRHELRYSEKSSLGTCRCGNWSLIGASEASATRSHNLHIGNLPETLLQGRKETAKVIPETAKETPAETLLKGRKETPAGTIDTPFGELCPKARRSLHVTKDILGAEAVLRLLPTLEFRTVCFECVD